MVLCPASTRRYQLLLAQSRGSQDVIYRGHLWNPVTCPRGEVLCPILPNSALSNLSIYVASLGQVSKHATTNQDSYSMQCGAVFSPALTVSSTFSRGVLLREILHSSVQKWAFKNKNHTVVKERLILEEESGQNWLLKIFYRQGNKAHPQSLLCWFLV